MFSPFSIAFLAVVEEALDVLWTLKPAGTAVILRPISLSVCAARRSCRGAVRRTVGRARPDHLPSSQSALLGL
jgi:hypothetical protein